MGKLVFNPAGIKLNKSARKAIDNKTAIIRKDLEKDHFAIAITPFNVDYEYKEVKSYYEIHGEEHCDVKQIPKCEAFYRITAQTIKDIRNLPCYEGKLLCHITCNLNWNSNVIRINPEDCNEVSTGARYVKEAINELVKLEYLAKTNIVNVYIINHNRMFYGDIRKFITKYNSIHEDEELVMDNRGRVVLKDERRRKGV